MTLAISNTAHCQPSYRRVLSEEGHYDALDGYVIIVAADGYEWYWTGGNDEAPRAFKLATAERLVERVNERGVINEALWHAFQPAAPAGQLPDYVLNPHRPEYN